MKINFPSPAKIIWRNGQRYLDGNSPVIVHMPSIGVAHGVKCVEYYQQKNEPIPKNTPTLKEAEDQWERQKSIRKER